MHCGTEELYFTIYIINFGRMTALGGH